MTDVVGSAQLDAVVAGQKVPYSAKDLAAFASIETCDATSLILRRRHSGVLILTTSASATSIIVPPSTQGQFPSAARVSIAQLGAGQVTFVEGAGVTIRTPETLNLAKQYAAATLVLIGADEWLLAGYLEAA